MLDIKAEAMNPLAAAEAVFEQSAQAFYLLTQPEYVGSAMAERAETCATSPARRYAPSAVSTRRTLKAERRPGLDPDAAQRVASFGADTPMRERGLQAVRDASKQHHSPSICPPWRTSVTRWSTGPGAQSRYASTARNTADGTRDRAPARRRARDGLQPFVRAAGRALAAASDAVVVAVDYRLAPEYPAPPSSTMHSPSPIGLAPNQTR